MLVRFDNKVWERKGHCIRCGFCCRPDYINYSQYREMDQESMRRFNKKLLAGCKRMIRVGLGICGCREYQVRPSGCRRFPWHPLQLSNTDFEDLPRIPIYKSGRYLTTTIIEENGELKAAINESDVTDDDFKIIGYKPLGTKCTYRFEDVTEYMKRNRPHLLLRDGEDPVVNMRVLELG